jgi:hypothetical protein
MTMAWQNVVEGLAMVPDGVALHEAAPAIDPTADEELTEAEIEQGLRELEALGYITRVSYPTKPTDSIIGASVAGGILDVQRDLRAATDAYDAADTAFAEAVIALRDSRLTYEYAELDFRAKAYAEGVPGKNEAERKVNLDLMVADDETLSELIRDLDQKQDACTRAEHALLRADKRHKALRAEITALGQLVAAS